MFCGPLGRRRLPERACWQVLAAVADRDPEPTAAFNYGEDRGHRRSGLLAADGDPGFKTFVEEAPTSRSRSGELERCSVHVGRLQCDSITGLAVTMNGAEFRATPTILNIVRGEGR